MNCLFCNTDSLNILLQNDYALSFYDNYPVTKYHTLIIPKRHVDDYFELTDREFNDIHKLVKENKNRLKNLDSTITGFNVGVNIGEDAGQSIFHVHVHLIPRRKGDMIYPKGGVRGVIPERQKY